MDGKNSNLDNLSEEKINSMIREFVIMSADPYKYFDESEKNKSNIEFVNNASRVFTAVSKGVDVWISNHPNCTVKDSSGRSWKLNDYLNKDLVRNSIDSKKQDRTVKYIDRLGYLLSIIPKVDKDFKSLIHYFVRNEFNNNIKLDNLCINDDTYKTDSSDRLDYYKLYPQYDFSFEGLQKTYDNYILKKDEDGWNVYDLNGVKCLDPLIVDRVKFASTWMVCAGVKSGGGDKYSKESVEYKYAFNDGAKDLYYDIMKTSQEEMLKNGRVDLLEIKNNLSHDYKYNEEIVNNIFNSDRYIDSLEKWMVHSINNSFDFANYNNKSNDNVK